MRPNHFAPVCLDLLLFCSGPAQPLAHGPWARPKLGQSWFEPAIWGPAQNCCEKCGPGTCLIIFESKSTQNQTEMPRWHVTFFQDMHFSGKKRHCATPEAHGLLAWLALACLAYLASDRPRSPCLHQQQQQRRSAPPGREGGRAVVARCRQGQQGRFEAR